MKIVIDIPDASYERFGYEYSEQHLISKEVNEAILDAFCNGTPLPKGHGRLVDENVIKDFKDKIKCYKEDYAFSQEEILNILERYEIKYAPTIIEADKAESEE